MNTEKYYEAALKMRSTVKNTCIALITLYVDCILSLVNNPQHQVYGKIENLAAALRLA